LKSVYFFWFLFLYQVALHLLEERAAVNKQLDGAKQLDVVFEIEEKRVKVVKSIKSGVALD
jgi:hypothetical protein